MNKKLIYNDVRKFGFIKFYKSEEYESLTFKKFRPRTFG